MADALIAVLCDPTRSGKARMHAASALAYLGRRFHRTALDGVLELLRSQVVPASKLSWMVQYFTRLGSGPRAELAEVLRAMAREPNTTATTVCKVAEALKTLDYRADGEVIAILRSIVFDDLANSNVRGEAAVIWARVAPEELAEATAVALGNDGKSAFEWERRVSELGTLGADLTPGLHALLANTDTERHKREFTAETLAHLRPDLRSEALAELRTQANDEFLAFMWRTDAVMRLVKLDPDTADGAIAYHRAVLDDEGQPAWDRCQAAYRLVQLDESFGEEALAALRRFATSLEFTSEEHALGVQWFDSLNPYRNPEVVRLGLSVACEPDATASTRSWVGRRLWGKARLEVERSLLSDRTASPSERVGRLDEWEHPALATEAEAMLRDILAGPETLPPERVKAAAALAGLSARHIPEAASLLEALSTGQCAAVDARRELASLGQAWRCQILADAERILKDEYYPWRRRAETTALISELTSNPPDPVVEHMRQLACDHRVADNERVEILYALRNLDGLDPLRQIRDDQRTRPAIRWAVANRLRGHAAQDRAAGAQVLDAIATDTTCRPALRWRASRDLTNFGSRGRALAMASLHALATDETLPLLARVNAARELGTARPDLRGEAVRLLRGLRNTEKPLARLQILQAIGLFDTVEGALALRDMSLDRMLNPGVRLRAADAMANLRRDYREQAAVVARELANSESAPRHLRIKAAQALARWSELCRSDARALLIQLRAK